MGMKTILIVVVALAAGYYVGAKNPNLLSSVTSAVGA